MDKALRALVLAGKMPEAYKLAAHLVMDKGQVKVFPSKGK